MAAAKVSGIHSRDRLDKRTVALYLEPEQDDELKALLASVNLLESPSQRTIGMGNFLGNSKVPPR